MPLGDYLRANREIASDRSAAFAPMGMEHSRDEAARCQFSFAGLQHREGLAPFAIQIQQHALPWISFVQRFAE